MLPYKPGQPEPRPDSTKAILLMTAYEGGNIFAYRDHEERTFHYAIYDRTPQTPEIADGELDTIGTALQLRWRFGDPESVLSHLGSLSLNTQFERPETALPEILHMQQPYTVLQFPDPANKPGGISADGFWSRVLPNKQELFLYFSRATQSWCYAVMRVPFLGDHDPRLFSSPQWSIVVRGQLSQLHASQVVRSLFPDGDTMWAWLDGIPMNADFPLAGLNYLGLL